MTRAKWSLLLWVVLRLVKRLDIGGKGVELVLDGGDINGDGDVDVGHFGGNGADRIEDNVVVGGGGGRKLDGGVSEEGEERD